MGWPPLHDGCHHPSCVCEGGHVHIDLRNEKMNAKIREYAMQKVPFQLVVGDKEMESGEVNVRVRG